MHTNFEKKKFHKQSVVILLKNGCSVCRVQYLFVYLWPKLLKNTFEALHLVLVFFKENYILMENLLNGYFYYNYFTPNFSNWYFSELLFLVGGRKINKIYQQKFKSGDRLWALEITLWKLRLYVKLFCTGKTLPLADLCTLLINTFEKLPLINSEANLRPLQHLKWSFLWH